MSQPHIDQVERQVEQLAREVQCLRAALEEAHRREATAAHAASEWEALFQALPDFVSVIDRDHRFVRVNRRLAERLGVTVEGAVGRACHELVHASGAPPAFCPHALVLHDGRPHVAEIYEPTLEAFFLVSATPLTDADGRVVGSVHVIRELPERTAGRTEAAAHGPAALALV